MRQVLVIAAMLVLVLAPASPMLGQEDTGIQQRGDRSPRGELAELFDDSEQPAGDPDQLVAEGWASYNRGLELRSVALEEVDKKRKKLEKQAGRAFAESERKFTEALQQNGELVDAYIGLARTWSATEQGEKVLQAWGEAYRRAPQREEVLVGLGESFMDVGRTRDAAAIYNEIKQHVPDAAPDYLERLRAYGEDRAAGGDEEAASLLAWIDEQV